MNDPAVVRSILDVDAAERDLTDDTQARRRARALRGARRIVSASEQWGDVDLDVPGVGHADLDAAHQYAKRQHCPLWIESSLSQVELDTARRDPDLATFPSLR